MLHCLVRRQWVAATPEETVRQRLLHKMASELGYPRGRLAVEISLRELPHLTCHSEPLPNRRADILCYAENIHPAHQLFPLLLIECKAAEALSPKVVRQVSGYNRYIGAPFICLVNDSHLMTGRLQSEGYRFSPGLPPYDELLSRSRDFSPLRH